MWRMVGVFVGEADDFLCWHVVEGCRLVNMLGLYIKRAGCLSWYPVTGHRHFGNTALILLLDTVPPRCTIPANAIPMSL